MNLVEYAYETARRYYTSETFEHAVRVAGYIRENPMISAGIQEDCFALALMHDLLEDTEYKEDAGIVGTRITKCLSILTRPEGMDYIPYIRHIRACAGDWPEAWWVKLADIKDHLAQTGTLTERLRDKYVRALPYLL